MADSIRINVDRAIREENKTVRKLNNTNRINKFSENDNNRQKNFKQDLSQAKKNLSKNIKIQKENEQKDNQDMIEGNILVESSLNQQLEKNRTLTRLVKEKFVNNSKINDKIHFETENNTDEETIKNIGE